MSLSHSPLIVRDGLVLCLDAANPRSYPKSGTTWSDLKGSNDGTLTNGPTFDADDKGSIVFDGTDDYISTNLDASSFSSTNTEFTVDIWMDADVNNSAYALFNFNNGTGEYIEIRMNGTAYRILTRYNSITTTASVVPFGGGSWANLTCVKAPGVQDIYLNGSIAAVGSPNTAQGDDLNFGAGGGVVIGCRGTPTSPAATYWNGKISIVRVYNQAMSAWEVSQNYNATRGRYGI